MSDPQSSKYGEYLTASQVADIVAPPQSELNKLNKWLQNNNINDCEIYATGDAMKCKVSTTILENIFSIHYSRWRCVHTGTLFRNFLLSLNNFNHGFN